MAGQPDEHDNGRGRASAQYTGSSAGHDELAVRLSESARRLQQQEDPEHTLRAVVGAACTLIPGADGGSISVVVARRHVTSQAASAEIARRVDALQEEIGQGPCLDAVYEQQTVRVDDMRTEQRWPEFSRRAAQAGAGSMLSFQLYVQEDNLGALNLYAHAPHAFDDESEHVGLLFAAHAAIAYSAARRELNLTRSSSSREVIGQAQGILMERYKVSAHEAFGRLVQASQHTNVKLRDVAQWLVDTGQLPQSSSGS